MKKAELEAQLEEQRTVIIDMRNKIHRLHNQLEGEQDRWSHLAQEYNAVTRMLQCLFNIQADAQQFDGDTPLWDVTDVATGEVLVSQQRDIAEAYRLAILKRMEAKQ